MKKKPEYFTREEVPEAYRIKQSGAKWRLYTRENDAAPWQEWTERFDSSREAAEWGEWYLEIAVAVKNAPPNSPMKAFQ